MPYLVHNAILGNVTVRRCILCDGTSRLLRRVRRHQNTQNEAAHPTTPIRAPAPTTQSWQKVSPPPPPRDSATIVEDTPSHHRNCSSARGASKRSTARASAKRKLGRSTRRNAHQSANATSAWKMTGRCTGCHAADTCFALSVPARWLAPRRCCRRAHSAARS
jgi:hypothetical protein